MLCGARMVMFIDLSYSSRLGRARSIRYLLLRMGVWLADIIRMDYRRCNIIPQFPLIMLIFKKRNYNRQPKIRLKSLTQVIQQRASLFYCLLSPLTAVSLLWSYRALPMVTLLARYEMVVPLLARSWLIRLWVLVLLRTPPIQILLQLLRPHIRISLQMSTAILAFLLGLSVTTSPCSEVTALFSTILSSGLRIRSSRAPTTSIFTTVSGKILCCRLIASASPWSTQSKVVLSIVKALAMQTSRNRRRWHRIT